MNLQPVDATLEMVGGDRRKSRRFSITGKLYYRQLGTIRGGPQTGEGEVVNLSGCGLLFSGSRLPPKGALLELHIEWPAKLDGRCPLKLILLGEVVRSGGGKAAIKFQKSEFRTSGTLLRRVQNG